MHDLTLYRAGNTPAMRTACKVLTAQGFRFADTAGPEVTHLLLPAPSFAPDGRIRGGGIPAHILGDLPESVVIIGGNLNHPAIQGYSKLDLLLDPVYTAQNAAVTADCAIGLARQHLPCVWKGCSVLILGWGRIGKCLSHQLQALGAQVTVAARQPADRAMAQALGLRTDSIPNLTHPLSRFRVIFNTVPAPVLRADACADIRDDCVKLELASTPGMDTDNVIRASGLPGRLAPETSGILIAQTVSRLLSERKCII